MGNRNSVVSGFVTRCSFFEALVDEESISFYLYACKMIIPGKQIIKNMLIS
jgi:hypothetical protein